MQPTDSKKSPSKQIIISQSSNILQVLEHLTFISCIVVGEILSSERSFSHDQEEFQFTHLMTLFQTNAYILKEFAIFLDSTYLFPFFHSKSNSPSKRMLNKRDFVLRLSDCNNMLIKPNDLRKKFTDFVLMN